MIARRSSRSGRLRGRHRGSAPDTSPSPARRSGTGSPGPLGLLSEEGRLLFAGSRARSRGPSPAGGARRVRRAHRPRAACPPAARGPGRSSGGDSRSRSRGRARPGGSTGPTSRRASRPRPGTRGCSGCASSPTWTPSRGRCRDGRCPRNRGRSKATRRSKRDTQVIVAYEGWRASSRHINNTESPTSK